MKLSAVLHDNSSSEKSPSYLLDRRIPSGNTDVVEKKSIIAITGI